MSVKKRTLFTLIAAAVLAAGLLVLRFVQLKVLLGEDGLLPRGSAFGPLCAVFVLLCIGALVYFILGLRKDNGGSECFACCPKTGAVPAGCALVILIGFMLQSSSADGKAANLVCIFGIAAAVALSVHETLQLARKKTYLWLQLFAAAVLGFRLIVDFRVWSYDPIVTDFCFLLLASVFSMLAVFNLAAFPLNYGKRRATAFLCLLAFCFSVTAIPDVVCGFRGFGIGDFLVCIGLGLYCLFNGLQLLKAGLTPAAEQTEEKE